MERDAAEKVPIGGKPKRKNQQAQAKAHAEALKKSEAASSSQATNELTFQELLGIARSIIKDWSAEAGIVIGPVIDQLDEDICWAICLARLLQAINNMGLPTNQHLEFSIDELVDQIIRGETEKLALANLKIAFKHIAKHGLLKVPATEHKRQTAEAEGKRVQETFKLYQDVDASDIRERLNRYPVALILEIEPDFSECKDGIYYLPKKKIITKESHLHSMLLIGYGVTKEGKLYFIGQNSYGDGWGCKGYVQIFIENKCDIFCLKEQVP